MTFAIWHQVLRSRVAMLRTLALLLRSAGSTPVAKAIVLGDRGGETEPELVSILGGEC
jgi:hypothetical protein